MNDCSVFNTGAITSSRECSSSSGRVMKGGGWTTVVRIPGVGCQKVAGVKNLLEHNVLSCGGTAGQRVCVAVVHLLQTGHPHRRGSSSACGER